MAVTSKFYAKFPLGLCNDLFPDLDAAGTTIKCALLGSGYTFDQETHDDWSDISANEVSGTGYTAGGAALANKALSEASRVTKFDADDVVWSNSTITARYAVLYEVSTGKLILCIDFGENMSSSGGSFTITWDAGGIFTLTVPA
ncbi:MAG: hypothetical protein AB1384_12500 [Actinomycetota bacterium]